MPYQEICCEFCGEFVTKYQKHGDPPPRFCSRTCYDLHRKAHPKNPIAKTQLEHLYLEVGLSDRQIAERTGITKKQVKDWRVRFGIPRRKPMETRFPNVKKPSLQELQTLYLEDYHSIAEIAIMCNCDAKSVCNWLREYGIPSRDIWQTRRRGKQTPEPSIDDLMMLYIDKEMSTRSIGHLYGLSAHTISDRLKKAEIPLRRSGYRQKRFLCGDGHVVMSQLEQAVDNWLYNHDLQHEYEPALPFNGKADFLVNETYIEVWGIIHNKRYDDRKTTKIKLYAKHGLSLIELDPQDILLNLDNKLQSLIC